jgi:hypothetical protein
MGRWSVDHVFLDQDGVPTLVEVKRSSDTRLRREVVGQLIDYAANAVVYWPVEKLRATFEARLEREGRDADAEFAAVLGPDADNEVYWEQAGANLKAGRIRMVFVADRIPRELRRVVEFLNEQMAAEVIADRGQAIRRTGRAAHARAQGDRPDCGRADAQATAREAPMG